MIIVADTSPLIVLSRIGRFELRRQLFGTIVVTELVAKEFSEEGVGDDRPVLPEWITIENPKDELRGVNLNRGELSAIALALERSVEFLLIDERMGRRVAQNMGIPILGTVGILERAADCGLVDLARVFNELIETGFWVSRSFLNQRLDHFQKHRMQGSPNNS